MTAAALLDRIDAAMRPAVPLVLGRTAVATRFGVVSRKLGFPYVLDRLALTTNQAAPGALGLQVYISDNDDLTDLTALTGDPVWLWRGDQLAGNLPIPYFDQRAPVTWSPRKRVPVAGTFIKALFDDATVGPEYWLLCNLQPILG